MDEIGINVPKGKPFDVVGLGQNSVDHLCVVQSFPAPDTKSALAGYSCLPGGQVATALVALQRWGLRTAYVGSFGDDPLGELSKRSLAREGIDLGGSVTRKGVPNQLAVILIEKESGERTVLMHRPPELAMRRNELREEVVCAGRLLHLDGYDREAAVAAASWAKAAGIPTVIDLDMSAGPIDELLPLIDVLIVSREFAAAFASSRDPERQLALLAAASKSRVVAVTCGADGVVAMVGRSKLAVAGHKVACVDTTGAGDIFHAGFIYGMIAGWKLARTLRFANAAAALSCTAVGGRGAIPTVQQALRLAASATVS